MKGLVRLLLIVVVLAIVVGVGWLATWNIPAPTSPIEKVIPNDRFSK